MRISDWSSDVCSSDLGLTPFGRRGAPPLWLLVMATASGTLSLHILVPALPLAARDLGVSEAAIQPPITQSLICLPIGQLIHAPFSDRLGRPPALLRGLLLYTTGGIPSCHSPTVRGPNRP